MKKKIHGNRPRQRNCCPIPIKNTLCYTWIEYHAYEIDVFSKHCLLFTLNTNICSQNFLERQLLYFLYTYVLQHYTFLMTHWNVKKRKHLLVIKFQSHHIVARINVKVLASALDRIQNAYGKCKHHIKFWWLSFGVSRALIRFWALCVYTGSVCQRCVSTDVLPYTYTLLITHIHTKTRPSISIP